MTPAEYQVWEAYHFAAFPRVESWLLKRDTANVTRSHWMRALAAVELADAKLATDELLCDTEGRFGNIFDETPQVIKRLATGYDVKRRAKKHPVHKLDDDRRVKCLACEDSTWIQVLTKIGIKFVEECWLDAIPSGCWWNRLPNYATANVVCSSGVCLKFSEDVAKERKTQLFNDRIHCRVFMRDPAKTIQLVKDKLANQGVVASTVDDWEPPVQHQSSAWD
jgi:hypothetical protein